MNVLLPVLLTTLVLAGCSDSNDGPDPVSSDESGILADGSTGGGVGSDQGAGMGTAQGAGQGTGANAEEGIDTDTDPAPGQPTDDGTDADADADADADDGNDTDTDDLDDVATGGDPAEPVALDEIGQELLVSISGFQADELSLRVRDLVDAITAGGEAMPLPASTFETLDGFGPEVVVAPNELTAYTCNAGGQMTVETGRLRDGVGSERSLIGDRDAFTFDACRHMGAAGTLPAGDYELDGRLDMDATGYSVSRGNRSTRSIAWDGFAMSAPGNLRYEVSGSVVEAAYSAANAGTGDSRTVELASYRKRVGETTAESLQDARVALAREIPNGSNRSSYSLDAAGVYLGPSTGGVEVTIDTGPVLSGVRDAEPFGGQVRMRAADGGELFLSGNPESVISVAPGDLRVDIVAMRPDGESTSSDAVPLIDIGAGGLPGSCFVVDAGAEASSAACGAGELP